MELLQKIKNQKAVVAIIGLGYIGFPLAYTFLEKNFKVIALEKDLLKRELLAKGKSYLKHIQAENLPKFIKNKSLIVSDDYKKIKFADIIIICVPTPLTNFREPDLSFILEAATGIRNYLRKNQLVILESSTYPGTTDELLLQELEKSSLKANKDFFIAYSPEREDPGNKDFSTTTIPKVVGADTKMTRELTKALYEQIISRVITVSSSKTAEATKLTENIFRSVNIALVNELKTIYDVMGVDIWEVIEAASTKPFGYMPFFPGPGLGGHCIPIDPFYLTYKAREYEVPTKFIELAGEINTSMPHFVVKKIINSLSDYLGKAINGSKILIIGMAYKKDIDDIRESPALTLINLLTDKNAKVTYHDKLVPKIPDKEEFLASKGMESVSLSKKTVRSQDLILIITDHSYLDFEIIGQNAKLIVDTRNAMLGIKTNCKVVKA